MGSSRSHPSYRALPNQPPDSHSPFEQGLPVPRVGRIIRSAWLRAEGGVFIWELRKGLRGFWSFA